MNISCRIEALRRQFNAFDYLRLILSLAVAAFHGLYIATGTAEWLWTGPYRFLFAAILPMFFALSGFLVAGSLERNTIVDFGLLRAIRIFPALGAEVLLSALLLGPLVTSLTLGEYLTDPLFLRYFLNLVGYVRMFLPGVFTGNPAANWVNGQLWTIPYELECYVALIILALLTVVRRPPVLAFLIVGFCVILTFVGGNIVANDHVPGRMLVLSFLSGVLLFQARGVTPLSGSWALLSAVSAAIFLQFPALSYLASLPIAYVTVWLGLLNPPRIPFGDLSYGLYLFHFPIQQTVVFLYPSVQSWWLLLTISLPVTLAFAFASWHLIEQPLLKRKKTILHGVNRLLGQAVPIKRMQSRRLSSIGNPSR